MLTLRTRAAAVGSVLVLGLAGCTEGQAKDDPEPDPTTTSSSAAPSPTETTDPAAKPGDLDVAISETREDSVYPAFGDPLVDSLHHRLDLTWTPEKDHLDAIQQLTFRATEDADDFELDFSTALKLTGLTVDGADTDYDHRDNKLLVHLPVEADERYVLQLTYEGTPKPVEAPTSRADFDGVGWHVTDKHETWTMQEPYGALTWYAVNDHPSDKALYDFTLTVPQPWTGVANGTLTETSEADGLRTTTWHLPQPASSYLVTVAFADYTSTELESQSGIPVTIWWLTETPDSIGQTRYAPKAITWLEEILGPYPFDTAGAVIVDSASGMETQTMITLGNTAYTTSRAVVVHELVHHWYGDSVSPADWSDVWMNEGMAMYLQWMWEAEHTENTLDGIINSVRQFEVERLRADYGPPAEYKPDHFGQPNIYYIPAVMWHELRGKLGDERFFEMVRAWPEEMTDQNADREEYLAWIEDYTGEELSAFFDDWLLGTAT